MLSAEQNRLLTQVGPGTKMGDYLRRYWHPIAGASEFDKKRIKPVRLMGEDLTLYKDLSGRYGLVDRNCAHRHADLTYGFVESNGIRCSYHGWCFDETGQCIEQPYEDTVRPEANLKARCRIKAYPIKVLAGVIFAYLGPAPAPELPVWDAFTWKNGFCQIVLSEIPCNWLQCQENSCDPVHFEWMHDNWPERMKDEQGPNSAPKHLQVKFEEFEYGFIYKRLREGFEESDAYWTVGRVALWPNAFYLGSHFEYRVPIDDENTLSVAWFFVRVPKGREPYAQNSIPTWYSPVRNPDGTWVSSHVMNQDFIAWVGQGRIADRTTETLGLSDRGIAMMRKRFFDDIEAVAAGQDPKGTIRDPEKAQCIDLPFGFKAVQIDGIHLDDYRKYPKIAAQLRGFRHLAGQPPEVRRQFIDAFGLAGTEFDTL